MLGGSVGELILRHRPDIAPIIETLAFEAAGGDAAVVAARRGAINRSVPYVVAQAHARGNGEYLPGERERLNQPVAKRPAVQSKPRSTEPESIEPIIWRPPRAQRPLPGVDN